MHRFQRHVGFHTQLLPADLSQSTGAHPSSLTSSTATIIFGLLSALRWSLISTNIHLNFACGALAVSSEAKVNAVRIEVLLSYAGSCGASVIYLSRKALPDRILDSASRVLVSVTSRVLELLVERLHLSAYSTRTSTNLHFPLCALVTAEGTRPAYSSTSASELVYGLICGAIAYMHACSAGPPMVTCSVRRSMRADYESSPVDRSLHHTRLELESLRPVALYPFEVRRKAVCCAARPCLPSEIFSQRSASNPLSCSRR